MKLRTPQQYLDSEFNGHKGDFADAFGVFRSNLAHYFSGDWLIIINRDGKGKDYLVKVAKERLN